MPRSNLNVPSARTRIDVADAAEIARTAGERDPNLIARGDIEGRLGTSPLILDGMRRRPHYFDGRFLTGADLTRDQDYIRQRQGDLARASGTGVITGLEVSGGNDPRGETLVIDPGHGVTPDGQLVIIERRREIPLLDLPSTRRLNATLGLRLEPRAPLGRRTGLFILALRPVEFTANPIAAYPTSISGPRHVEDGDIIEATALTLIPYPGGGIGALDEARRLVAREIFLGEPSGIPQDALPLAMLALDRGALAWIDLGLVRRETGADTPLQVSMGARPRALAEAFVLQHQEHLADVIRDRRAAGLPDAFAAAQSFAALPPAGLLPAASILPDQDGFRQLWFPPSVDVELAFAPADEIAALVEESLALPAIDLNAAPEELDATSVVVIAPVTRSRLQRFAFALERLTIKAQMAPALGSRRAPAIELAAMLARRHKSKLPTLLRRPAPGGGTSGILTEAEEAALKSWQAAWAEAISALPSSRVEAPMLWYVRRRAVPQHSAIVGTAVPITGGDQRVDMVVRDRTTELGLATRVKALADLATPAATAMITSFLGAPRIVSSAVLLTAAVHALEAAVPAAGAAGRIAPPTAADPNIRERLAIGADRNALLNRAGLTERTDLALRASLAAELGGLAVSRTTQPQRLGEADVARVSNTFAAPDLGDGIALIEKSLGEALPAEPAIWLGDSGLALQVDRLGIVLSAGEPTTAKFAEFATLVSKTIEDRSVDRMAELVKKFEN